MREIEAIELSKEEILVMMRPDQTRTFMLARGVGGWLAIVGYRRGGVWYVCSGVGLTRVSVVPT